MNQAVSLQLRGLVTNENEQATGEGSLIIAENIVIDKVSVAQLRRGFEKTDSTSITHLAVYKNEIWKPKPDLTGTLRTEEAHSNLYISTDDGIMKIDSPSATPIRAGVPKALDVTGKLAGIGGVLPKGESVSYRVVWGYRDENKNLCLGSPSQPCIVIGPKAGDDAKVELSFSIPHGIDSRHFYQVYRSISNLVASDELSLCFENELTPEQLKNRSVTVTDFTPRSELGASLYTNATQEGILQSNDEPPIARDLAIFRDCMFYGNTIGKHRLTLTLNLGLEIGDVLTIGSTQYTAKEFENIERREFQQFKDAGSMDIAHSMASLVRVINGNDSGIYAYSLQNLDDKDTVAKFLLDSWKPFTVSVSANGDAFDPLLPKSSSSDVKKNGVFYSKFQQPEAVPLLNSFICGNDDRAILKMVTLREALFIFTEGGIYRVSGWTPETFYRELFDSTVKLLAPNSATVLSNHIFALTNQGIVAVNDSGVVPVSRNIENMIQKLLTPEMRETTARLSFGIGYESDRKYILFAPTLPTDTQATQAFVYNFYTKAWTRWKLSATCGLVHPIDDKLYLGTENCTLVERKTGTQKDFYDEDNVVVGRLEWTPVHAGAPFMMKQFSEAAISFKSRELTSIDFRTELSDKLESVLFQTPHKYCRTYVPAQKQLGAQLFIGLTCAGPFELDGVSVTVNGSQSERITR